MVLKRAPVLGLATVAGFVCCAEALAAGSATGQVRVSLSSVAGVQIVTPLVLPTVTAVAIAPATGVSSTAAPSSVPLGNASLTIRGQAGDAVSTAVPASFKVIRSGGTETLTVRTNTETEFGLTSDGMPLSGTIMNADTMSVNVGNSVALASTGGIVPGPYEGLLVVVVQYN